MCGIAGYFNFSPGADPSLLCLEKMIWSLRHRGPDGFGFFQDQLAGLAHARLSIIDLEGGWQPISNEDATVWVIFNGEIFNYIELRAQLVRQGHLFATQSDTEVLVHLYEEQGEAFVRELNGQFALGLYDSRKRMLLLARDHMGIRPLFYCRHQGRCYFGSEIKAIFSAEPSIPRIIDPQVLMDTFTFWNPVGGDTIFSGVEQVQPGHLVRITEQGIEAPRRYWDIDFRLPASGDSAEELAEQLLALLIDAVRLQLRSDVPVGAYLSGGLDSSTITSLVRHYFSNTLTTFSVAFADAVYDERAEQQRVNRFLNTDNHQLICGHADIAAAFPAVIRHAETPLLRTAPAPMYLLSGLVRQQHGKVVLTGEGADEIFGGYDLFKEAKVRAFIAAAPDSPCRSKLLKRLYPYLAFSPTRSASFAKQFFAVDTRPESERFYGHQPRWRNGQFLCRFLADGFQSPGYSPMAKVTGHFARILEGLDYFAEAQYVESKLLLANYLLSSQGDRMAMAHSVEGRYPFLDYRLVEFAASLPMRYKIRGLNEKYLLKKAMHGLLPGEIIRRNKQPYMAPDIPSFFGPAPSSYAEYLLSPSLIRKTGMFHGERVKGLVDKCRAGARQGFRENMALVGILSTQCLHDQFVANWQVEQPAASTPTRKIIRQPTR